jgi:hypothetical protein
MRLKHIAVIISIITAASLQFFAVDFVSAADCAAIGGRCTQYECQVDEVQQGNEGDSGDCQVDEVCCAVASEVKTVDESLGAEILKEPTGEAKDEAVVEPVTALKQGASKLNPMDFREPTDLLSRAINAMIGFMGSIALILYIYAGLIWMSASGNSDKVSKAKNILVWTTLGIVAMAASYMIIRFVIEKLG